MVIIVAQILTIPRLFNTFPLFLYMYMQSCNILIFHTFCFFIQEFACNGTVVDHPEYGEVIQLQGDQRNNIYEFLEKVGIAKKDQLKVHGF